MRAELLAAEAAFAAGKIDEAMNALGGLFAVVERDPRVAEEMMQWIVGRVGDDHPQVGAHIALAGGALVEGGAGARAIGRAIIPAVERTLRDAERMFAHAKQHGHQHASSSEDDSHDHSHEGHDHSHEGHDHSHEGHDHSHEGHDHDHDHDHDDDHEHAVEIGGYALSDDDLRTIAQQDVAAVRAWFSLDMWYRPAVACWTRDLAVLREVQSKQSLRAAIAAIGRETQTSYWLSVLVESLAAAPMIVLVPELGEAWSLVADGIVDMGQLTVLASKALADPIRRIGGSGVAAPGELDVMSGEAEQSGEGGYSSSFAFYPVEATDPTDGLPRDGIHMWSAPGGTGSHSLPGDFLPGTLAPIDNVRVLVMVGPKAPGLRFVRIIQNSRMFDALKAELRDIKKLPDPQAAQLIETAKQRGAAVRER